MFTKPMQIGIANEDAVPEGWHFWCSMNHQPKSRILRHADWLGERPVTLDGMILVRAVPGMPTAGIVGVCAGDWPVSAAEARAVTIEVDDPVDFIRAGDPQRGYALTAPVHLTDEETTPLGADGLWSAHFMGRVRWEPQGPGWLAEAGWCGSTRTIPGGHSSTSGEATERLADWLRDDYVRAMQAAQADCGGDVGWGGIGFPREFFLRAAVMERRGSGSSAWTEESKLSQCRVPAPCWAEYVQVRPVDHQSWWIGTDCCQCPDCRRGTLQNAEAGNVPGFRRCDHCGSEWQYAAKDGNHILVRTDDRLGETIGECDLSALTDVEVPDQDARLAAYADLQRSRKAEAKSSEQRAMELLRAIPELAGVMNHRGLRPGTELRLGRKRAVACGPVRIDRVTGVLQAQVEYEDRPGKPWRIWASAKALKVEEAVVDSRTGREYCVQEIRQDAEEIAENLSENETDG